MDFIGVQELGGQKDLEPPWQPREAKLDGFWNFYTANPPLAFRAVAVGISAKFFPFVEKVTVLSCGLCVTLKQHACRTFVISAHLPHKQRSDCIETWQSFNSELDALLHNRRLHDTVIILHDTNYELGSVESMTDPNSSDERGFLASGIIQQHGFVSTSPTDYTWCNSRGSHSKIDYILVSTPTSELLQDKVHLDSDYLLGSDHRAVSTAFRQVGPKINKPNRGSRVKNRCGQWRIDGGKALLACNQLAEHIEVHSLDFNTQDLEKLAHSVSFRPHSFRYVDPPNIKDMIKQRRLLTGQAARNLGKDILRLRAAAKSAWLTELLDKGAQGNYSAIAYFKRRQNVLTTHNNYVARAGGVAKATHDLKVFYRLKYTPPDPPPFPDFPMSLFLDRVGPFPDRI